MSNGVNLSSGQLDMAAPGVGSGGLGMVTAFSARYNNIAAASTNAGQGYGWQTPYVPTAKTSGWSGADVMFQNTSGNMEYMKAGTAAGTYDALFGNRNTLSKNTTTNELTLKAADGTVSV